MPPDVIEAPPPFELLEVAVGEAAAPASPPPPQGRAAPRTLAAIGVAIAAVAGLIALVLTRSDGSPFAAAVPVTTPPPGLAGFAEMYVATYLTAVGEEGAAELRRFYASAPAAAEWHDGGRYVTRTAAVALAAIASGHWEVEVAADVLAFDGAGYRREGIHHYLVGITDDAAGFAATSLPARIPPPAPAPLGAVSPGMPVEDPVVRTLVEGFLAAYLTGEGDVRAYATEDVAATVEDAFVAVAVSDLAALTAADGHLRVRVTGTARDGVGASLPIEYHLDILTREAAMRVGAVAAGPPPPTGGAGAGSGG